jgi:hypothetical protein
MPILHWCRVINVNLRVAMCKWAMFRCIVASVAMRSETSSNNTARDDPGSTDSVSLVVDHTIPTDHTSEPRVQTNYEENATPAQ